MPHSPDWYQDTALMDLLIKKKIPWAAGNIMKYVYRWEKKDGVKDLYKARDYLNALIAEAELVYFVLPKKTPQQDLLDYPHTQDLTDGIK